jgi:hypothetical protein
MGLFDLIAGSPEKRVKSLQKKVTEKYGPPENRQKAIEQLLDLGTPEALSALMMRFTVNAEPSIADAEEKEYTYQSILHFQDKAVAPLKDFVRRSEKAVSWALRMLRALLPEPEVVSLCLEELTRIGPEYTRDPEKKTVLLSTLGELNDERIALEVLPFLADPSDDVRIAAATVLKAKKDERAREALLKAWVDSLDRKRVVDVLAGVLADTGFGVQGFREKIEKNLPDGFYVDKAGLVKRRG